MSDDYEDGRRDGYDAGFEDAVEQIVTDLRASAKRLSAFPRNVEKMNAVADSIEAGFGGRRNRLSV